MTWGVIATGGIAHAVTADMLKAGVQVGAVSSRDIAKAQQFAEKFGIPRAYGDYHELLADPEIQIVYVATPHGQHHEVVLAALDADKSVLCEKALALTVAQVEEMVERARSKQLFLMEAMWTRFNPLIRKIADAVENGEIGDVREIRADFGFNHAFDANDRLWAKEAGGGSVLDLGVYPISLAHLLLGVPSEIHAHGSLAPTGVDADAGILLGYEDGAHALLGCSLTADTGAGATIVGTKGRIDLPESFFNPTRAIINGVEHVIEDGGYTHQIRSVDDWVALGYVEHENMTLNDSLEIMRIMETALGQLGVSYADTVR
ncbi:Gfo/Idh/MocA family protein [Lentzea sp. NPDC058450]|uniref:Gfo/Idh/MocA family protein n=1 Tax=Lentzea sp. NPDC058450 TaxID=3346505 RepID=UPI003654BB45